MMTSPPAASRPVHLGRLGLTLIEVLVALGIVAVSLMAGLRASTTLIGNAQRLDQVWLAQICAENTLINLRLSTVLPSPGVTEAVCTQLQQRFRVEQKVSTTPNPSIRRLDIDVLLDGTLQIRITSLIGGRGL